MSVRVSCPETVMFEVKGIGGKIVHDNDLWKRCKEAGTFYTGQPCYRLPAAAVENLTKWFNSLDMHDLFQRPVFDDFIIIR